MSKDPQREQEYGFARTTHIRNAAPRHQEIADRAAEKYHTNANLTLQEVVVSTLAEVEAEEKEATPPTRAQKIARMVILAAVVLLIVALAVPIGAFLYHHGIAPFYRWGFGL